MTAIPQTIFNKARSDKFLLVLTLPPILKSINAQLLSTRTQTLIQQDSLQFAVWGGVVPNISIPPKELGVYGQHYKVTSEARASYPPITVNFTIDNRFNNYWVLWRWLEFLNEPRTSGMNEYFGEVKKARGNTLKAVHPTNDYQTIITVFGLDEYDNKIVQFDYFNSFITEIGEIRYNYREPSELESNFQFVFNQLDIKLLEPGTGSPTE